MVVAKKETTPRDYHLETGGEVCGGPWVGWVRGVAKGKLEDKGE